MDLIFNKYAAHKHPDVERWLVKHLRFVVYLTLTSAPWLNAVKRFTCGLSESRIASHGFTGVCDLKYAITQYIAHRNANPEWSIWRARNSLAEAVRTQDESP